MNEQSKVNHYPPINSINNLSVTEPKDVMKVFSQLMSNDYAKNTKKAIVGDLKSFLAWYEKTNGECFNFTRLVQRDIVDFKNACVSQKQSPATINRKLVSIRLFCDIAVDLKIITVNPSLKVKQLAKQSLAPKGLTSQQVRKLLKEVELRGQKRDVLIVEMLLNAGLRVSELVNLSVKEVYLSERKGYLLINNAKGGKTREVPLKSSLRELLGEYIKENKPTSMIFTGQRGDLHPIAINKLLDKYGEKANVKLSPHTLRHTFAYNYLKSNPSDIVGLSQILGHSNINTTAIYTQNRLEDLQEKVERLIY